MTGIILREGFWPTGTLRSSHGSVSVFNVGIGIRYFCRYFFQVGSVFGIGISKYRDIGSVFRYFSWSTLRVTDKLGY